ncbi:MAG: SRPBCC family protein [Verrucomicrobiae bacterium]|nr:SRPBCC family protein [Verrucomicrobiae bacterium]
MPLCSYSEKIELNAPVDKVFEYFSDTEQLPLMLPPSQRLRILRRTARHLGQGVIIEMQARFLGFPVHLKSYVISYTPRRHIAYVWQRGPLNNLEHNFYFESLPNNQTRVIDCLLYTLPFGSFSPAVNRSWISPFLRRIFEHRRKHLLSLFRTAVLPDTPPPTEKSVQKNHGGKRPFPSRQNQQPSRRFQFRKKQNSPHRPNPSRS